MSKRKYEIINFSGETITSNTALDAHLDNESESAPKRAEMKTMLARLKIVLMGLSCLRKKGLSIFLSYQNCRNQSPG